ncbi:MAG: hypothetical protein H7144_09755 [Burkholderiales bacterium]|nr:hypothetical protein [Phycisphaerae bacterium]
MPVIKSTNAAADRAIPFSIADIEAYARTILLRARQEADQLLAAAQTAAEALKAEGRSEGLALGKKEGLTQGRAEGSIQGKSQAFESEKTRLTELLTTMQSLIGTIEQQRLDLIDQAEAEVLPLALAIAAKITWRVGAFDAGVVEANVAEAVRLVTTKHDLRIFVHPTQKHTLEDIIPRLKQQWPQLQHVGIEEDAAILAGGCRVVTAGGEIDARLETQLDQIARELVPEFAGTDRLKMDAA